MKPDETFEQYCAAVKLLNDADALEEELKDLVSLCGTKWLNNQAATVADLEKEFLRLAVQNGRPDQELQAHLKHIRQLEHDICRLQVLATERFRNLRIANGLTASMLDDDRQQVESLLLDYFL